MLSGLLCCSLLVINEQIGESTADQRADQQRATESSREQQSTYNGDTSIALHAPLIGHTHACLAKIGKHTYLLLMSILWPLGELHVDTRAKQALTCETTI